MAKFTLTKREDQLRSELAGMLEQFHATWPDKPDLARNLLDKMADLALKLHQSLKKRGHEPKHSAQMLRNRRVAPDTKDFYSHVHPIEDLLQIVSNPEAQARSTDTTIGQEFRFQVFSHRWGHEENYKLKRTETGWYVEFMAISGPCDKQVPRICLRTFGTIPFSTPQNSECGLSGSGVKRKIRGSRPKKFRKHGSIVEMGYPRRERATAGTCLERGCMNGVITFLDVLGWKGIYDRDEDPIAKMTGLFRISIGRCSTSTEVGNSATAHEASPTQLCCSLACPMRPRNKKYQRR